MLSKLRLVKELRLEIKTRNELQLKVFNAQGNKTNGSDCCIPFTCSFHLWLFCLFVQKANVNEFDQVTRWVLIRKKRTLMFGQQWNIC